jgi:predicted AAA+ superfamily ATPase
MEYYPRKIDKKLEKWMKRKEIILMKGPRQSGKTTTFQHLHEKHGGHYVTLEDDEILQSFENSPREFVKRYLENKNNLLFIDEAQYSKNAGKNIKLLYDLYSDSIKLFVTGSGSFDIKVEIGKYLVGRAIYLELHPLDFEEFLLWKAKDLHNLFLQYKRSIYNFLMGKELTQTQPVFQQEFQTLLQEYLLYGGYPAIVKEEETKMKIELLKNLARTYLEKDVFFFFNIAHLEKFKKVMNYLSFTTGSLLEISSIMNELHIDFKTVEHYLSILASTSIISLLSPYHKNLTTELKKAKKIYFNDTGLRNSILNNFLPLESRIDRGIILENFICNELTQNFEGTVRYWRTTGKAEIDFIVPVDTNIIPIEVKSHTKPGRSFFNFLKTYQPKRALVFTEKEFEIRQIEHTTVAFIPHYFI